VARINEWFDLIMHITFL